jgi:hypothetical protein
MNFNTVQEVTRWKKFSLGEIIYDLSHLDAHFVTYVDSSDKANPIFYKFIVTYGLHCFTRDTGDISTEDLASLMYSAPKESRPFNFERYELSKNLPAIVNALANPETLVFHAGYGKYASVKVLDASGVQIDYFVAFAVFKESKKLRLHVHSAYPKPERIGKIQKVRMLVLAKNLLEGKKLPKPR